MDIDRSPIDTPEGALVVYHEVRTDKTGNLGASTSLGKQGFDQVKPLVHLVEAFLASLVRSALVIKTRGAMWKVGNV
jgi:hypothetical protein